MFVRYCLYLSPHRLSLELTALLNIFYNECMSALAERGHNFVPTTTLSQDDERAYDRHKVEKAKAKLVIDLNRTPFTIRELLDVLSVPRQLAPVNVSKKYIDQQ